MISRFVVVGLLAAAMAVTASAQRGGGGRGGGMGDNMPSSGPARVNRLDMLSDYLKLSKDQKKDLKNTMDEGQKEAAPLRDQMAKGRAEVAAAVASGKAESVDQAVKSYGELEGRMAAIEMKAFAQIYNLLDSDQKTKTRGVFTMMGGIFSGKNWMEVTP
jgi:Spy/CpxP family protein refolding chaperone